MTDIANIPALLLGALLYPNNYNNKRRRDRSILYTRENVHTCTGSTLFILQLLICYSFCTQLTTCCQSSRFRLTVAWLHLQAMIMPRSSGCKCLDTPYWGLILVSGKLWGWTSCYGGVDNCLCERPRVYVSPLSTESMILSCTVK